MSRKQECLDAAAKLASKHGAINVSRVMVAEKVGVSSVLVGRYIGQKEDRVRNIKSAMRKLGLVEPDKAKIESEGVKLRAHGPRQAKPVKRTAAKPKVTAPAKKSAKPSKAAGAGSVAAPGVKRKRSIAEVKVAGVAKTASAKKVASSKTSTSPPSSDQKSVGDAPSNKAMPAAPINKARTPRKPPTNAVVEAPATA